MRQPVSCDARRTFWPFLPMASDSLSSGTISSMRVRLGVDDHARHLGRRDRVAHEARRIVVVGDDVDLLAAQLLHHRLHARALHADAGADRIDVAVARADTAILARAPGSRADASMRTIFS